MSSFTGFSGITCVNKTSKRQQYISTGAAPARFVRAFCSEQLLYKSFVQTNFTSGTICHRKLMAELLTWCKANTLLAQRQFVWDYELTFVDRNLCLWLNLHCIVSVPYMPIIYLGEKKYWKGLLCNFCWWFLSHFFLRFLISNPALNSTFLFSKKKKNPPLSFKHTMNIQSLKKKKTPRNNILLFSIVLVRVLIWSSNFFIILSFMSSFSSRSCNNQN